MIIDSSHEEKLISVIILDCRKGIYWQRCINSIRRQTYKNTEIIAMWDNEDEIEEIDNVNSITAPTEYIERINVAIEKANGEYIFFLSYYSLPAPNCLEELFIQNVENNLDRKEDDERILYVANEVNAGSEKINVNSIPIHLLQGKLFEKKLLKESVKNNKKTYCCIYHYVWDSYKKYFDDVKKSERAYIYTTPETCDVPVTLKYDAEIFENTVTMIPRLEEVDRITVEKVLIEDIKPTNADKAEKRELVYKHCSCSYKLMMNYVINDYIPLYKNACKNLDDEAYNRVKGFLMRLEADGESELLKISLSKIGLTEDMYAAMKHLDMHNYKYTVEDNTLFLATVYPEGIKNLYGEELIEYVISRYADGRLGAGTIVKSMKAWAKYKMKG